MKDTTQIAARYARELDYTYRRLVQMHNLGWFESELANTLRYEDLRQDIHAEGGEFRRDAAGAHEVRLPGCTCWVRVGGRSRGEVVA